MHKAILFDLGKVLVHFDWQRACELLAECCPYKADEIPLKLEPTGLVNLLETGGIEPHLFLQEVAKVLDLSLEFSRFCEIYSSIFAETLVPDSLVEGLSRRYRMVLVSNTNAIHFPRVVQSYPILRHFDALVLSHEVKAMKPDRRMYDTAVQKAGCRPEECFYTDDILRFVEAAKEYGIDAEQFQGAEKLERDLRARGINWD